MISEIEKAIDFYHSMDLGENGSPHWREWWQAGYDLLERIQNLDEHSLYNAHIDKCGACQELNLSKY